VYRKEPEGWLQEANTKFPRTHDVEQLLDLIVPVMPAWDSWRGDFQIIETHAVDLRYPGRSATDADAQHAMQICSQVRQIIRTNLGLPT
jgi:HEPN domain